MADLRSDMSTLARHRARSVWLSWLGWLVTLCWISPASHSAVSSAGPPAQQGEVNPRQEFWDADRLQNAVPDHRRESGHRRRIVPASIAASLLGLAVTAAFEPMRLPAADSNPAADNAPNQPSAPAEPSSTPTPSATPSPSAAPDDPLAESLTGRPSATVAESEPDGAARKRARQLFRGTVVPLVDALARRDIKTSVDELAGQVVLEQPDGELIPILPDWRGRAFFQDPRLRDRPVELVGIRRHKVPYLQVLMVFTFDDEGRRQYTDYWCDICSIPMYEIKPCDCCQQEIRLRFQPQELPKDLLESPAADPPGQQP
jgi:hypothetical protein